MVVKLAAIAIEHRRAEEAQRQSEQRLRALVESLDEVVFEADAQGRILAVRTSNEDLLVLPKERIIGLRAAENRAIELIGGGEVSAIKSDV